MKDYNNYALGKWIKGDGEGTPLFNAITGDQLRTDLLCSEGVCVEALTDLSFHSNVNIDENIGFDAVNEWTLQLLRIRHLGNAEQRLQALFSILVNRLGRRCGQWCELPFRLTHERIGELIGSTRVTSTRLISKLRSLIFPVTVNALSVILNLLSIPNFTEVSKSDVNSIFLMSFNLKSNSDEIIFISE